jgi:hypothetical protein
LEKDALQPIGVALKPQIILCRREDNTLRRLGLYLADMDEIARSCPGIGALQPVQPKHVQPLIFLIRTHDACGGGALSGNFDHVAFDELQFSHRGHGQARKSAPRIFRPCVGYLNLSSRTFLIGHRHPHSCRRVTR